MSTLLTLTRKCVSMHEETLQEDSERDFIDSYLVQMRKADRDPGSSFHKVSHTYRALTLFIHLCIKPLFLDFVCFYKVKGALYAFWHILNNLFQMLSSESVRGIMLYTLGNYIYA